MIEAATLFGVQWLSSLNDNRTDYDRLEYVHTVFPVLASRVLPSYPPHVMRLLILLVFLAQDACYLIIRGHR
jgi:hypothetical protein